MSAGPLLIFVDLPDGAIKLRFGAATVMARRAVRSNPPLAKIHFVRPF